MSDYASPEHAKQLVNHWYWRPGRQFYTWHLTFETHKDLHRLVASYQEALHNVPELDVVPLRWLHITMQGVGFVDEVSESDIRAIGEAVAVRAASISSPAVTFHRITIRPKPSLSVQVGETVMR